MTSRQAGARQRLSIGGSPRSPGGFVYRRSAIFALILLVVVLSYVVVGCRKATETPAPSTIESDSGPESAYPPPENTRSQLVEAYPQPPKVTPFPTLPYPVITTPVPVETPVASGTATRESESSPVTYYAQSHIPLVSGGARPNGTPELEAADTPSPTPTPTIDFEVERAQLQAQGQDLAFAKIGFHTSVGGNRNGLGDWMRRLDATGVPFFLKSADDAGPLFEAQQIMRNSDIPHTLVYRRSGDEYDTPNYDLNPREAARQHWQLHKEVFPPELDPNLVWIETINEVDKERSEWLAIFALETARLAMADGYRWAAFGWSSGEPEISDWSSPAMLEFLRLASANPDRLAIALHEYSFIIDDIGDQYPFKVGRFQQFFEVTDRYGIPRPTVLLTEWGWEYRDVPSVDVAMRDIEWAASMYAPYPEIKGAAIWHLGSGYGDIADQTQKLIAPLTNYSRGNFFAVPLPPIQAAVDPEQFRP